MEEGFSATKGSERNPWAACWDSATGSGLSAVSIPTTVTISSVTGGYHDDGEDTSDALLASMPADTMVQRLLGAAVEEEDIPRVEGAVAAMSAAPAVAMTESKYAESGTHGGAGGAGGAAGAAGAGGAGEGKAALSATGMVTEFLATMPRDSEEDLKRTATDSALWHMAHDRVSMRSLASFSEADETSRALVAKTKTADVKVSEDGIAIPASFDALVRLRNLNQHAVKELQRRLDETNRSREEILRQDESLREIATQLFVAVEVHKNQLSMIQAELDAITKRAMRDGGALDRVTNVVK